MQRMINTHHQEQVGKTKNNRKSSHKKRFGEHIDYNYIDEVNSLKYKDWKPLETYWINQFKAWGFDVLNENDMKKLN